MSNKRKIKRTPADLDPVRAKIAELVAGGVVEDLVPVDLPRLEVTVHLRRIGRTEVLKMGAYAAADDPEDMQGRGIVGILRWMLVDDKGRTYLDSYEASARFLSNLHDEDFQVLFEAVSDLRPDGLDDEDDEGDDVDEVDAVDAGKER